LFETARSLASRTIGLVLPASVPAFMGAGGFVRLCAEMCV
jgi:hypothetical protein